VGQQDRCHFPGGIRPTRSGSGGKISIVPVDSGLRAF
jgi:hypothetical protein